jgi:hypothetical protein
VNFRGGVVFGGATFQGRAGFSGVIFQGDAWFDEATFQKDAWFDEATFQGNARFSEATFAGNNGAEGVAGAQVLHLNDPELNKHRVWPDGCTVHPDPADPTRGTLVREEQEEESDPAVSPSDRPTDGLGSG